MLTLAVHLAVNIGCVCVGFLLGLHAMFWIIKTGLDKTIEEKMWGEEE